MYYNTNDLFCKYIRNQQSYKVTKIYALNHFADDVIWVGTRQDQYIIGKKEAQADLEADIGELQLCHLLNAEFNVVASTPKVFYLVS